MEHGDRSEEADVVGRVSGPTLQQVFKGKGISLMYPHTSSSWLVYLKLCMFVLCRNVATPVCVQCAVALLTVTRWCWRGEQIVVCECGT